MERPDIKQDNLILKPIRISSFRLLHIKAVSLRKETPSAVRPHACNTYQTAFLA
jgi:hypothetical protein